MINYEEYKRQILDVNKSPKQIMKEIMMPQEVFKYRKFIDSNREQTYWKESMKGEMYFSLPTKFNSNDSNDCKMQYDKERVRKEYVREFEEYRKKGDNEIIRNSWECLEKIIIKIRENLKIGCFTVCSPENAFMWENEDFGGKGRGYCIEYAVNEDMFYPNTIKFLPVSYMKNYIDMTEVIIDFIHNIKSLEKAKILYANGYNFALSKLLKYKDEEEWRIIVPRNRYEEYFNLDGKSKKDFSQVIKAIYLGTDYKQIDNSEEYKKYALRVCEQKNIPLYEMKREGEKLIKVQINN